MLSLSQGRLLNNIQFSSVLQLSYVQLFATPWTAAHQASLSVTNSQSLFKLMSIQLVMPFNHLILCRPLLLLPSIFPSIRVFSNESVLRIRWPNYWSFSFNISPSSEHQGLISFRMEWLDILRSQVKFINQIFISSLFLLFYFFNSVTQILFETPVVLAVHTACTVC